MSNALRERLTQVGASVESAESQLAERNSNAAEAHHALKQRMHQKLLDRVDLALIEKLSEEDLRRQLKGLTERLIVEEGLALNEQERRRLIADIQNEVTGLGPLEPLLADPTVSDILVNTHRQVYVERKGRLELTNVRFGDEQHLMKVIDKIVSRVGRRIDESSPMVDARLPDGSRVNAIIPPLAIDGALMSIRRFAVKPLKMDDLLRFGALTPEMAQVIEGLVKAKMNMLVSGGTGTGKTTLLNILSGYIPAHERVVTIEDAAELQLQQPHVVRLETRPPNIEGKGEITQRQLVKNSLRMRPDRVILGEIRGEEVVDMLQAMNTGHEGSMSTVHANTPRDALSRLENMIGMAGLNLPGKAMRQQIASALSVIVQATRLNDGKRRITSIQEIVGMEGEVITMQEIFAFEQTGMGSDGAVQGRFVSKGIRPKFVSRLRAFGVPVRDELFEPRVHNV